MDQDEFVYPSILRLSMNLIQRLYLPSATCLMNWTTYLPIQKRRKGQRVSTPGPVSMNVADEVDYEYTSLKPYVEMFEKHVAAVLRDARLVKKGESSQSV